MKLQYILIMSVVIVLCSCVTQRGTGGNADRSAPEWYEDIEAVYPEQRYMATIGLGDSPEEAKARAAGELAGVFKLEIRSSFESEERYSEIIENNKLLSSETETAVSEEIIMQTDIDLINMQYSKSYYNSSDGQYYVVAYIDRGQTASIYRSKIISLFEKVSYYMEQAEAAASITYRYVYLKNGLLADRSAGNLMEQLRIIQRGAYRATEYPYDREALYSRFDAVSEEMTFAVSIQNDWKGQVASLIKEQLTENNFKVTGNTGLYTVEGKLRYEQARTKQEYEAIRWYLQIDVRDENDNTVVTLQESDRETAISLEAARSFAYSHVEEMLREKFMLAFLRYLEEMVSG